MIPASAAPVPPKLGPFLIRPGKDVVQEFLGWVAEHGTPDLWRFHEPSPPPKDQDFEEIVHFEVSEVKRRDVPMATCPICSPTSPQYYSGVLAWFPAEGVLRAIGIDCARSHFGAQRHNAAIAARKLRERVDLATDFLLDTLPSVAGLREEIDGSLSLARDIDRVRNAIWRLCGRGRADQLARAAEKGALIIEESFQVTKNDRFGKDQVSWESRPVASFSVQDANFLRRRYLIENLVTGTASSLLLVHAADPNAALEFVAEKLTDHEHLFQAERLARAALREVEQVREAVREARSFLSPANLRSLSSWTMDSRSGAPCTIDYDVRYPSTLKLGPSRRSLRPYQLPEALLG